MGGRKEEREGQEHRQVRERWSVVVPEEEAWMTQATGLCNQKGRERQRQREERGRGRHTGDRGEREHTHFCNLIRESSRLLPSASKGYGHVYTHTHTNIKPYNCTQRKKHGIPTHKHKRRACLHTHTQTRHKSSTSDAYRHANKYSNKQHVDKPITHYNLPV